MYISEWRTINHNYMQTITYAWGTLRRWTNSAVQADETTVARPGRRWGVAQKWCCFGACCLSMYSVRRSENRKRRRQAGRAYPADLFLLWAAAAKGMSSLHRPFFFLVAAEEGRKEGQPKRHDSDGSTTTATAPGASLASHLDRLWLLAKARQSA